MALHSEEHMNWLKNRKGESNPNWSGDKVQYKGLHQRIRRNFPPPKQCQDCGVIARLDLANISGKYLPDYSDWEYLCRRCHMNKDGRMNNLQSRPKLTTDEVIEIYKLKGTITAENLSKNYKVKPTQIRKIWRGEHWSNITKGIIV